MPITVNVLGRGPVTFPDGMSKADMEEALRQLPPMASAPSNVAPATSDEPSLASKIWNNAKSPVRSVLELSGRPGEALQGLVAGTLQGGVGQGLKRGFDALTEADLVNSKIEESTSKTLQENNILADSPKTRAALGFVGDVVSDPLNLLGGAGVLRRGAMSGAQALGASPKAARAMVGLPIADVFANKVIAPAGKAITKGVAHVAPALMPGAKLRTIVDATGESAYDMKRIAEGKKRAAQEFIERELIADKSALFHGVPMKDRQILAYAREYPQSAQALHVASDPRLANLLAQVAPKFDAIYAADVSSGILDATKHLDVTDASIRRLSKMTPTQLSQLEQVIKTGAVLPVKASIYKLADQIKKAAVHIDGADTLPIADLSTLKFVKDAKGRVAAEVSSEMPNYLGHYIPGKERPASIFSEVNPALRENKNRATSLKEAVAKGAPDDIAEILIKRTQNSARATIDKQLIEDYTTKFGKATNAVGLDRLSPATLERLPEQLRQTIAKTPWLPAEIVADLERYAIRVNDPEKMVGVFTQGTRLFRALATSMNLGTYQVNNFVGNVTNMYGSGMSMDQVTKEYWNASRRINARNPIPIKSFTDATGKVWHDADVMKAAKENGVYGHVSGYSGELGEAKKFGPSAKLMTGKLNPLNPENEAYKWVANKSQSSIEDPAKLGMFIHELKQGRGVDKAVLNVKNTLFDYAELSDKERQLRHFVPFYTWTRKNLPLQVINLAKNPKSVANQGRLLDLARELAAADDVPDVDPSKLPEWLQKGNTVPIPGLTSNEGKAVLGTVKTPLMDLNLLSSDLPETAKHLAGMVNPLIKTPYESIRGEKLDTGAPIREGHSNASLVGRLLRLGKTKPDGTRVQQNWQKHLTESLPVPAGSLFRSMPYAGEKDGMPWPPELVARILGLAPQAVTSELMKKARSAAKAKKTQERKSAKDQKAFDKLD